MQLSELPFCGRWYSRGAGKAVNSNGADFCRKPKAVGGSPTPVSHRGRTVHCIIKQNDGERARTDPDVRGNELEEAWEQEKGGGRKWGGAGGGRGGHAYCCLLPPLLWVLVEYIYSCTHSLTYHLAKHKTNIQKGGKFSLSALLSAEFSHAHHQLLLFWKTCREGRSWGGGDNNKRRWGNKGWM